MSSFSTAGASMTFRKSKFYGFDKKGNRWKERTVGTVKFPKNKVTSKAFTSSPLLSSILARAEDKARGSSTSSQQQFQIDVACGNHGAANGMALGKGYVDVSTVDVDTSKLISERIKATGALFLEPPVSGSKKLAEDGQLIFLTAGDRNLYETVAPLLDIMGKLKFYLGDVENGAAMKLVNMIMGSMMASFSEGLLLSEKVGLDPKVLVEVVSQGAISAPMYSTKGPSMIQSVYPTAFPLKHQQKDLRLALGLAESVSQSTPIAAAANELYKVAKSHGLSDEDFSAVIEALKSKFQQS